MDLASTARHMMEWEVERELGRNPKVKNALRDAMLTERMRAALEVLQAEVGRPAAMKTASPHACPALVWKNEERSHTITAATFPKIAWERVGMWDIPRNRIPPELERHLDFWTDMQRVLWQHSWSDHLVGEKIPGLPMIGMFFEDMDVSYEQHPLSLKDLLAAHYTVFPECWTAVPRAEAYLGPLKQQMGAVPTTYHITHDELKLWASQYDGDE